jgi:hypothetical protein
MLNALAASKSFAGLASQRLRVRCTLKRNLDAKVSMEFSSWISLLSK